MRAFAGTFHRNRRGDWVKCVTEGGKPCSRHSGGEHIRGADLEEALENLHANDDVHGLQKNGTLIHHVSSDTTVESLAQQIFPDTPSAIDISHELLDDAERAFNAMTDTQVQSVSDYTDSMFTTANKYLNTNVDTGRKTMDAQTYSEVYGDYHSLEGYVDNLHEAIGKSEAPRDMLVYRSRFMGSMSSRSKEEESYYDAIEYGDDSIVRANFNSTSADADNDVSNGADDASRTQYIIKVPAGTNGLYIRDHSYHPDENEYLIDRGYRYRIVGIYERGTLDAEEGTWDIAPIIALEIMPRSS